MGEAAGEDEGESEFLTIARHPRARDVNVSNATIINISSSEDERDTQRKRRRRSNIRTSSQSTQFAPVNGLMTYSKTPSGSSSNSNKLLRTSSQVSAPTSSIEVLSDNEADPVVAPAPVAPMDELAAVNLTMHTRPELLHTLMSAQQLKRAISSSAQAPVESPSPSRPPRRTDVQLLVLFEGVRVSWAIPKTYKMCDFFPLIKTHWRIDGEIVVKTNGIVLTGEDTADSVGLTDGTEVVVTHAAGSAPSPLPAAAAPAAAQPRLPVARVLDLDASPASQDPVEVGGDEGNEGNEDEADASVSEVSATSAPAAAAAEDAPAEEKLTIKFRFNASKTIKARFPRSDTFDCIMQKLCVKQHIDPKTLVFMFEGQKIDPRKTPSDLHLEDDDIIEVAMRK